MKEVLKYLGLAFILAGVIILSIVVFKEEQSNTMLAVSLGFIVSGFLGHILLNKFLN